MATNKDVIQSIIDKTNAAKNDPTRVYQLEWVNGSKSEIMTKEKLIKMINEWIQAKEGWQWVRAINTETHEKEVIMERKGAWIGRRHVVKDLFEKKVIKESTVLKDLIKTHEYITEGKFKVGDAVANKRTKWIGTILDKEDRGEIRTDADGNVNVKELEIYNPKKHKNYHIAPSIKKKLGMTEGKKGYLSAGTMVWVEPSGKGYEKSYPATKWLKKRTKVKLIDDAPNEGTLDVLDVELSNGKEESIYDFNIDGKA